MNNFYTYLPRGFANRLNLPEAFSDLIYNMGIEDVDLLFETPKGSWAIKVRASVAGCFYLFGDGWEEFVYVHELSVGEIIIFEQKEELIFKIKICGLDGCEKNFESSDEDVGGNNDVPSFQVKLTQSMLRCGSVGIPITFARENALAQDRDIKLRHENGNTWEARTHVSFSRNAEQVRILGMQEFFRDNSVNDGDECIFELVEHSTVDNVVFNVAFL